MASHHVAVVAPVTTYPQTKRVDVVENIFGQLINDPYRWLENDVRTDEEVAAWVEGQNEVTNAYLAALPGRVVFKERLKQLFNYERFTIPVKKGSRYFYLRNSGTDNQQVLYVRDSVDGAGRMLIDPNSWAKDGATALAEWAASSDGAHVAYAVQDGGTDWRTIKVLDVNTGKVLADALKWARFTSIAWSKDNSKGRLGFFYARFPEPKQGAAAQANVGNHAIYFHALGTPQEQDTLVYATPDQPTMLHFLSMTEDGRYLSINSTAGSLTAMALIVVDIKSADWKARTLFDDSSYLWGVVGNIGSKFFMTTTKDAPQLKVVTMDIAAAKPVTTDVVPEQDSVMSDASLVGDRLLLSYSISTSFVNAKAKRRQYKRTASEADKFHG